MENSHNIEKSPIGREFQAAAIEAGCSDESGTGNIKDSKANRLGEKDTEAFPEGGRGWLVVVGTALIMNTTYGFVNAYGIFQVYYQDQFPEVEPSTISLIGALQPAMMYLSCIPVVFLHNTIGTTGTIALGSLIMVFSLMMLSLCKEIWQIYLAQGVLYGFGGGINMFTSMSVPQEWFKEKRALAVGITAAGSSLGGLIWPIAIQRLFREVGFGWTTRIIAFIFLVLLSISCLTVKNRLVPHKKTLMPKFEVLKDWRFVCLSLCSGIGFFGLFPPIFYIQDFANKLPGVHANVAEYIIAILNAMSLIGRIGPGYLGDKFGRLNVLVPVLFLCGIMPLVLWVPENHGNALLVCFAVIWGCVSGAFISLIPSSVGQLFGIKDLGSRFTFFFLLCVPGSLAGPAICGTFIGETGIHGFYKIGVFSGIMLLASAVLVLILRLSYSRKLWVFV